MLSCQYLRHLLAASIKAGIRLPAKLAAVPVLLAVVFGVGAQEPVYDASQVKAAFLYHFGTYVQWPAAGTTSDPITIAVLGDESVAEQLAQFLPGRRIQDRPVEVRVIDGIGQLGDEEVLFIGSAHNRELSTLIDAIGARPVLLVTDAIGGLESGAMVNFQLLDARVRFEISLPRAQGAGLTLSSRLLSAAFRVES
jgi:hypothetical protein